MERHEIEDTAPDLELLAELQGRCPDAPLQILEAVARLPAGAGRDWTAETFLGLQGLKGKRARLVTAHQLEGMFRYAYAVNHVSHDDRQALFDYLASIMDACAE